MLPAALKAPASPTKRDWRGTALAALTGAVLVFTTVSGYAAVPEGFADLVDKVKPAVVNVSTTQKAAERQATPQLQVPPELRGSPFEEFFRRFMQPRGEDDDSGPGARVALGSGFIIDASGYVVTNNHVVKGGDKIQITLTDGRKLDAKLIGQDEKTDIALLKVESKEPLPFVSWGDSDKLRVGDWVIAVGNPFGLGGSVTAGIVSARGRDIQSGPYDDFLQIDAPINRGNSGGPSFDRGGNVIGINTAIYSPSGGSIGIGFAIPASLAKPVVEELRTNGRIERGWLGVNIQPVTREIADSLGLAKDQGALVAGVTPDSPAAKAGLRQGDVIRSLDGHEVAQFRDVPRLVANARPNARIKLGVWRGGKDVTVEATLAQMPTDQVASADDGQSNDKPSAKSTDVLGLGLASVTRETRQRFNLPSDTKGAVVVDVKRDGPAAEAGLRPGDVIVKVGDKNVAAPRDVVDTVRAAGKAERKAVLLLVQRQGNQLFVAVPIEKA